MNSQSRLWNRKLVWGVLLIGVGSACFAYYSLVSLPKRQLHHRKTELMVAGLQFHYFYDAHSRPPANLDEFTEYALDSGAQPRDMSGFSKKIESGQIIFYWNSKFLESGWENDQHVLAYESIAPVTGGLVLMGGGSVDYLSADEFAAMTPLPTYKTDASKLSAPSGTTLMVLSAGTGKLKTDTKANVTLDELAESLGSTNWSERPVPQLSLSRGGIENINILAEHSAPDDPVFIWVTSESGTVRKRRFGPITPNSPETLRLLQSYLMRDDEYETMVDWND